MTTKTVSKPIRLSADRAARFLERAVRDGNLPVPLAEQCQQLVNEIDAGQTGSIGQRVQALVDGAWVTAARAAVASTKSAKAALVALHDVAQLEQSLGLAPAAESEPVTEPAPEPADEPAADTSYGYAADDGFGGAA
ncbi:hypothetical protein [Mycolicibacter virginiensis]|uniref:hypothetical protein n=1 Tax=Mycolicibacter virginiensis TaxID=1795032 RepID=UPI001F03C17B|nr:hypothetical protein [Mycolicibacter virginiensis]ULP45880.1 hypothetical protein MJO54_13475 [Mycolicibacter virginiensis]